MKHRRWRKPRVGDVVVCVDDAVAYPRRALRLAGLHVVNGVSAGRRNVRLEGNGFWWRAVRFEHLGDVRQPVVKRGQRR